MRNGWKASMARFVVFTAKKLGAKILTGDPHFKGFKEAVMI